MPGSVDLTMGKDEKSMCGRQALQLHTAQEKGKPACAVCEGEQSPGDSRVGQHLACKGEPGRLRVIWPKAAIPTD